MDESVNPEWLSDELIMEGKRLQDDPELMLRIIDLLFLGRDDNNLPPS